MAIESEMLADAGRSGLRITEVEIGVRYDVDGSTMSPIKHGLGVLVMVLKDIEFHRPLYWRYTMDLAQVVLYIISFLLIWQFVGYPLLMSIVVLNSKSHGKDDSYQPFVSILVATYNESLVIEDRIKNLFQLDYPCKNYEIIVIDSGSTDSTVEIVKRHINSSDSSHCSLKLIQEGVRKGKVSAINLGKELANGEIILVTDANSIFDKSVLKKIIPHFKDQKIGAVSGRYIVSNPYTNITESESFYWEIESLTLLGESTLDSISTVIGTISAWRKNLMDFSSDTLSEDLDLTIKVRRKGYKVIYEPEAIVYEPSATLAKDQIKQRKRTCIGTIQNTFKHLLYFITSFNYYSLIIYPSHKVLPMLSPFLLIAILTLYFIIGDFKTVYTHFTTSVFSFVLGLSILFYLKSKISPKNNKRKPKPSIYNLLNIFNYVMLNEYLILIAWRDLLLKNYSVLWDKAESTRPAHE